MRKMTPRAVILDLCAGGRFPVQLRAEWDGRSLIFSRDCANVPSLSCQTEPTCEQAWAHLRMHMPF